ncbi:hypothetical protein ACFL30_01105 [Candidatus Latescibacterota bacterium]
MLITLNTHSLIIIEQGVGNTRRLFQCFVTRNSSSHCPGLIPERRRTPLYARSPRDPTYFPMPLPTGSRIDD